ncbi:hypothetical protein GCM10011452_16810 [Gemmobacter lanyuensis]|uniref:Lipopolysaccharide export system protein LptC n=1 Tax=Gemmobacter lanyuensis TaxID=1054497 RepID=A0A918IRM3_9RHOB|nr:hypothetical protein [Gemmobacter lanyuensis]GGW28926.1 hypothetical protein GCM10011452_16810 [Gemmobacter lanyuensis]
MDRHSRLVGWLKVALPLMALAILSSLFLVARQIDPQGTIGFSEAELADRLREPRITAPTYAGTTRDGATLTISADEARPDAGNGATAAAVHAELSTADGARSVLTAGAVRFLQETRAAVLEGGVLLANSLGYEFRTEAMTLTLDTAGAKTAGAVEGFGPLGRITAGQMQITPTGDGAETYLLVFNGGVRLIYQPRTR